MGIGQPNDHPAPLIVLCPPRSFSSLLCAMLGQHPQLYGFPELNLFLADDIGRLLDLDHDIRKVSGHWGIYTAGLVRAIAELESGGQAEAAMRLATTWLERRRDWRCTEVLNDLLRRIAPRIGVEKSPRTVLSESSLRRMLDSCPGVQLLHLARHPVSCVASMMRSGQPSLARERVGEHDGERARFCAELWCEAHERILDLANARNAPPILRVRGEDLIANPEPALARIMAWLELDSAPAALEAMLHPERSSFANPGPWPSWGDQDPRFLASPALDASAGSIVTAIPEWWGLEGALVRRLHRLSDRLGYTVKPAADL